MHSALTLLRITEGCGPTAAIAVTYAIRPHVKFRWRQTTKWGAYGASHEMNLLANHLWIKRNVATEPPAIPSSL
jgi:hypothetical protein